MRTLVQFLLQPTVAYMQASGSVLVIDRVFEGVRAGCSILFPGWSQSVILAPHKTATDHVKPIAISGSLIASLMVQIIENLLQLLLSAIIWSYFIIGLGEVDIQSLDHLDRHREKQIQCNPTAIFMIINTGINTDSSLNSSRLQAYHKGTQPEQDLRV